MMTRVSGMTMTGRLDTHTPRTCVCFFPRRTRKQYNVNILHNIIYIHIICVCVGVSKFSPDEWFMGGGQRKGHCSALHYIYVYSIIGRVLLFFPSTQYIIYQSRCCHRRDPSGIQPLPPRRYRSTTTYHIYSYFYYYCAYITIILYVYITVLLYTRRRHYCCTTCSPGVLVTQRTCCPNSHDVPARWTRSSPLQQQYCILFVFVVHIYTGCVVTVV